MSSFTSFSRFFSHPKTQQLIDNSHRQRNYAAKVDEAQEQDIYHGVVVRYSCMNVTYDSDDRRISNDSNQEENRIKACIPN